MDAALLSGPRLAGQCSGACREGLGHHLSHPQERGEFPDEWVLSVGDRLQVEACGRDVAVEQLLAVSRSASRPSPA